MRARMQEHLTFSPVQPLKAQVVVTISAPGKVSKK